MAGSNEKLELELIWRKEEGSVEEDKEGCRGGIKYGSSTFPVKLPVAESRILIKRST